MVKKKTNLLTHIQTKYVEFITEFNKRLVLLTSFKQQKLIPIQIQIQT